MIRRWPSIAAEKQEFDKQLETVAVGGKGRMQALADLQHVDFVTEASQRMEEWWMYGRYLTGDLSAQDMPFIDITDDD